jgi:hypothetical protein
MPMILANSFDCQQIRLLISSYQAIFNILPHIFIQSYTALFYLSYVQQTIDDMYYGIVGVSKKTKKPRKQKKNRLNQLKF